MWGERKILNYLFPDLRQKRKKYGYVKHMHTLGIYICYSYTYATHLHILNICTRRCFEYSGYVSHIHMLGRERT